MASEHNLSQQISAGSESEDSSGIASSETSSSYSDHESIVGDSHMLNPEPDESTLGRWPRRLLHVDRVSQTLTSYEWEPGNTYGGHKEPKYNVISYTWGRFRLKHRARLDVNAIDIGGVTWAIPRIDPNKHFSVEDFGVAIRTVCTERDNDGRGDVHFVWLDVACIDQENRELKMLEVGRQTVIFQHAESAFIWLASSTLEDLHLMFSELQDASTQAPPPDMAANSKHISLMNKWLESWLERSWKHVEYILKKEPWFTSLWTLQETYLRPFAVILARDGRVIQNQREGPSSRVAHLRTLAFSVSSIARHCRRSLALGCNSEVRVRVLLERI